MSYSIRFDGCGATIICAQSHSEALHIADGLRQRGRRGITITISRNTPPNQTQGMKIPSA